VVICPSKQWVSHTLGAYPPVLAEGVKRLSSIVKKEEYNWKGFLLAMFMQSFLLIFCIALMKIV
jgi:hypothetical protein